MRPRYPHKLLFVALILSIAMSGRRCAADDFTAAAPTTLADGQAGVLLLQDGGVLTGTITQAADWYVVGHAGGQMQVASARVQFVGHTLAEAYQFRCQHSSGDTVESHLLLADWCLRYNLLDEAGKELAAARNLGPDHPRLALLDRRLSAAKEKATQLAHASISAVPSAQKSASTASANGGMTSAVRPDVSNAVVEVFTRKVQPVLVNNCTVSKCHEPGGQQTFQLNRAVLRGEANRRTTMQNLAAALALIDRVHPDASQLLTVPRQSHGGMNAPIFGARQEPAFKHLADWVALVAPTNPADLDAPADEAAIAAASPAEAPSPKNQAAAAKRARLGRLQPTLQPVDVVAPASLVSRDPIVDPSVEPASATDDGQPKTLRSPHRLKVGVTAEKWQPRDAFDPEIFNRQMHPPEAAPPASAHNQRTAKAASADTN